MRRAGLLGALLVAAGAALRVACLGGDLAFDEVWSLELVGNLRSALGVFTGIHHDNNHHLSSLWLYALGPGRPFFAYRLLALAAGIGTVALARAILARRSALDGVLAAFVAAGSYPLVYYATEARGYALAIFCAAAAFALATRERPAPPLLLGAVAVLGILSHLTFLLFFASLTPHLLAEARRRPRRERVRALLGWLAPPAAAVAALWLVDLRKLTVGGGNAPLGLRETLVRTLALAFGQTPGPAPVDAPTLLTAALMAAGAAAGLLALRRERSRLAFPLACVALLPIAGTVLVTLSPIPHPALHPRYLILPSFFLLLAGAAALADLWRRRSRAIFAAAVAAFSAANGARLVPLAAHGRADYSGAVAFIVRSSRAPAITVSAENDFNDKRLVAFYGLRMKVAKPFLYIPHVREKWPPGGPEWVLKQTWVAWPPISIKDPVGNRYAWVASFPPSGVVGIDAWTWYLYRNVRFQGPVVKPPMR